VLPHASHNEKRIQNGSKPQSSDGVFCRKGPPPSGEPLIVGFPVPLVPGSLVPLFPALLHFLPRPVPVPRNNVVLQRLVLLILQA
jgi:hypothetical protein